MSAATTAPGRFIAAVQGAPSTAIQGLFRAFVDRQPASVRIAGILEETPDPADPACAATALRSLGGARYTLFQDLGPDSTACGLEASGVLAACQAVKQDIEAGCALVILSKFGKLEADRGGLADAFAAAIQAGVPILTAVSPRFADAWERFAAPLFVILPPDARAIEQWWRKVRPPG